MEIIMRSKLACYCVVRVHFQCLNRSTEQKKTHTHPRVWCKMMDKVRPRADYTDWMIEREWEKTVYLPLHIQNHGMLFIYNHVLQQQYTWTILQKHLYSRGCACKRCTAHYNSHTHIHFQSIHPSTHKHTHTFTYEEAYVCPVNLLITSIWYALLCVSLSV